MSRDKRVVRRWPRPRASSAALVFLLLGVVPDSDRATAEGPAAKRLIGLLNLPEVVGEGRPPSEPKNAVIYDRPSKVRPPIGSIEPPEDPAWSGALRVKRVANRSDEELPTYESGYEYPAAIVQERAGRWFRIALAHGSAWIVRDDPKDFLAYPALLTGKLDYLEEEWDGKLWETPDRSGALKRLSSKWKSHFGESIPIEFLGTRRIGGEIWIRVRLEPESCGERLEGVSPVEGWLPAYRPSGETTAWFYSRGC